jgi:hypothetical protein
VYAANDRTFFSQRTRSFRRNIRKHNDNYMIYKRIFKVAEPYPTMARDLLMVGSAMMSVSRRPQFQSMDPTLDGRKGGEDSGTYSGFGLTSGINP